MKTIKIGPRPIGEGRPCFIVAEISANHNRDFDRAKRLIALAKECGADAVKLQTYTADTMTIDCANEYFTIAEGPWKGQTLYQLYQKASMPWEWHAGLWEAAKKAGLTIFSTPFDATAVEYLERLGTPVYKIASFEIVDIPLIRLVAAKGKPVILSTGMATLDEIKLAIQTMREAGNNDYILLKCTSSYPAPAADMNLKALPALAAMFSCPVGLSDHSLEPVIACAAVGYGACLIEKHFTDDRANRGPDSDFSLEPAEFRRMVRDIRVVEQAAGQARFGTTPSDRSSVQFRKSIFAVKDIARGEPFTTENIRVIRPGHGLSPKYYPALLGTVAKADITRGTPLLPRHGGIKV